MSTREGPKPVPEGMWGQIFSGVGYPLEAFGFLRKHGLWGLAVVPVVVNIVLFSALLGLVIWQVVPMLESLDATIAGWFESEWLAWMGTVLSWAIWIIVFAVVLAVTALLLLLLGQAVASPFLDVLSEKVETIVLGTAPQPTTVGRTVRSVLVALADVVWTIVFFVTFHIPLLLANVIPVVGSAIAAVLSFGWTALLLTQEFAGLPMARNLASFPQRWRVVWRNRWSSLGFGSTSMVLLMVPGINLVLLPLAAVGGTLLYCDLKAAGRVDQNVAAAPQAAA